MTGKKPSRSRYLQLCREECERWGVDYALTIGNARWRPAAYVRSRVSKQLVSMGYGIAATGRTMRMDHTTILHNLRRSDEDELRYLERGWEGWSGYLRGRPIPKPAVRAAPRKLTHRWLREPGKASEVIA